MHQRGGRLRELWRKWIRAVGCDPAIWKRGWRIRYYWLVPSGYGKFRLKIGLRQFMPYPGIFLLLKAGKKQHCIWLQATFCYSNQCRARATELDMTPYQLAGRTETP